MRIFISNSHLESGIYLQDTKLLTLPILAGLDQLDEGKYSFNNVSVNQMDTNKITALRKEHFGFIFQSYHLLENLDVSQT